MAEDAGVEARYDYLYSAEELTPWVERVQQVAEAMAETFVVTNNHFRGKAVTDAVMLEAMLAGTPMPAPQGVLETYGDVLGAYASPP